ncbi:hypothetical protein RAD15_19910 [Bradyrhizobium sp. 14AA]
MFKQFLLVAAIASLTLAISSRAHCEYASERSASTVSRSASLHSDGTQPTEDLLDDIVAWVSSNFDLPAIKERPAIESRRGWSLRGCVQGTLLLRKAS